VACTDLHVTIYDIFAVIKELFFIRLLGHLTINTVAQSLKRRTVGSLVSNTSERMWEEVVMAYLMLLDRL
jgi:hypothetical protein